MLVHDVNRDGRLNDRGEFVFARHAGETDLQGLAAQFDSNGDGVFDARDEQFGAFGVWQDVNGNGISEQGELRSLSDLGISALQLHSDGVARQPANGVTEAGRTVVEMEDGSTRVAADASFAYESGAVKQTAPGVFSLNTQGLTLDLAELVDQPVQTLDLAADGSQTVRLSLQDLLAQQSAEPLKILGTEQDAVEIRGETVQATTVEQDGVSYQAFDLDRNGSLDLLVQQQVLVTFQH